MVLPVNDMLYEAASSEQSGSNVGSSGDALSELLKAVGASLDSLAGLGPGHFRLLPAGWKARQGWYFVSLVIEPEAVADDATASTSRTYRVAVCNPCNDGAEYLPDAMMS